jgi:3-oxoadipate enol-lactonase
MALVTVDDGARINVEADPASSKPVLVFSNSLGTDHRLWDPQLAAFREKFRLIRYDTRGHGQSDAPKGPYSIERLGRDVLAILDHFKIDKTYYCGLSLGGMTGMWLGVNAGDRLVRLALCDCAAKVPVPDAFRQRGATVRASGIAGIVEGILERWFTEPFRKAHPETLVPFRETLLKSNTEGYAACCEAIADMDLEEPIRKIKTPTLVLVGADDVATPPSSGKLIHSHIAGSRFALLPNAAHITNVEQVAMFNREVLGFLGTP